VEDLEKFQQSRRVIEDFTSHTLAAIPSDFGKLHYLSGLRDSTTGRYEHDGLAVLYSEHSVQQALAHCHEELFSRILETPLTRQESDLHECLEVAGDQFGAVVEMWRTEGSYRAFCPEWLPSYLTDLFCSNLNALLCVLSAPAASAAPRA
jgi:hypothetical protein